MALKILLAPSRYIQGPNALAQLGEQLRGIGIANPLLLVGIDSPTARETVVRAAEESLNRCGIGHSLVDFGGECTWDEIKRVKDLCIKGRHDAIVSCGGGKTIDTGRSAASESAVSVEKSPPEFIPQLGASVACVNIPTVITSSAATSAISLIYSDQGVGEAVLTFQSNPAMVLADTEVIARSPVRLLVAGIGDALATYFEADVSRRTGTPCLQTGAHSTLAARALGRLCLEVLLDYGTQAIAEAETHTPGPGIEAVTEANLLLSGLGAESGGLSAAHAIETSFRHIQERFEIHLYHGELVAFGCLTQLVLEGRKPEYLERFFRFCRTVGLPTTFEELRLRNVTDEDLITVADSACRRKIIGSMPGGRKEADEDGRYYDHRAVYHALKATDAFGRSSGKEERR